MKSSNPAQAHDSPLQSDAQENPLDPTPAEKSNLGENQETNELDLEEEEEEEGECGFCVYMKAGGCRESFIAWEDCIEEGEKNKEDIVDKCQSVTKALKDCMEANPDHYGPILDAEKAAEVKAAKELVREMEKEGIVRTEVEKKQSGSVAESVATFEVETSNSGDSEQKVRF